ncbi:MAG: hypothetical protein M0D55_17935 [Elusimicrobiota bacterium]|nr:MAG: hypothetical protein M0D55_17935 [Elusimicrobiota bacterium]
MNERLYQNFEQEKKRMGIAQIIEKGSDDDGDARQIAALSAAPAPKPAARARAKAKAQAASAKALALKSAEALTAAWTAASLAGEPPSVAFPKQMALFLACPGECGIVDVQERKRFIVVLYKGEGFPDPAARVRAVPVSAKPVVVKRAE